MSYFLELAANAVLSGRYANRHGLITGSTGSGKTMTMLRLASEFNRIGVPVFMPDVKGDVWGAVKALPYGEPPVNYLDPADNFSLIKHRVGAELLARAYDLTDAQQGILEQQLSGSWQPHRAIPATIDAFNRKMNRVVTPVFDRKPRTDWFDVAALIANDNPVSILRCSNIGGERIYGVVLIHMLKQLYDRLPERGDQPRPILAFFVDEAHLLFEEAPPRLVSEIVKIVKLIRSKGVSLWFISQSPADIPDAVLSQLGNRIQHSLRASTPAEMRAVQAAVDTMPGVERYGKSATGEAIKSLRPGEAFVSLVTSLGTPSPVTKANIKAPVWQPAAASADEVRVIPRDDEPAKPPVVAEAEPTIKGDVGRALLDLLKLALVLAPIVYLLIVGGLVVFGVVGLGLLMAAKKGGKRR